MCHRRALIAAGVLLLAIGNPGTATATDPASDGTFYWARGIIHAVAFDQAESQLVAVGRMEGTEKLGVVRVYDVETGRRTTIAPQRRATFIRRPPRTAAATRMTLVPAYVACAIDANQRVLIAVSQNGETGAFDMSQIRKQTLMRSLRPGVLQRWLAQSAHDRSPFVGFWADRAWVLQAAGTDTAWNPANGESRDANIPLSPPFALSSEHGVLLGLLPSGQIGVWDLKKSEIRRSLAVEGKPRVITISPDGAKVAIALAARAEPTDSASAQTGLRHAIEVVDLMTGQRKAQLLGHRDAITSIGFACGGAILVSGSFDRMVRCWGPGDHRVRTLGPFDAETAVWLDGSDRMALVVGVAQLQYWSIGPDRPPQKLWSDEWKTR